MPKPNPTTRRSTRGKLIDLSGQQFGKLTVSHLHDKRFGAARWACQCICGKTTIAYSYYLRSGHTKSCGCLRHDNAKHGKSTTRTYAAWQAMRDRCFNNRRREFRNYGARGITVCAGWGEFTAFLSDVGERPTAKHSLDRRDNDGNYSCGHCEQCIANSWPLNCRWATSVEQNRNTRNNVLLTIDGETRVLQDWANLYGMKYDTISGRLKAGWTVKDAVTLPPSKKKYKTRKNE